MSRNTNTKKSSLYSIFLVLVAVIIVGGIYTFYNAKGMSYFSDSSSACNNCHIMNDVYNDWSKGSHSQVIAGKPRASCGDCHLPHEFVDKWIAKAESGVAHAYAFTFKLDVLPLNLEANAKTKKVVQQNCIRCHSEMVSNVVNPTLKTAHTDGSLSCVSCHAGVGHSRGF